MIRGKIKLVQTGIPHPKGRTAAIDRNNQLPSQYAPLIVSGHAVPEPATGFKQGVPGSNRFPALPDIKRCARCPAGVIVKHLPRMASISEKCPRVGPHGFLFQDGPVGQFLAGIRCAAGALLVPLLAIEWDERGSASEDVIQALLLPIMPLLSGPVVALQCLSCQLVRLGPVTPGPEIQTSQVGDCRPQRCRQSMVKRKRRGSHGCLANRSRLTGIPVGGISPKIAAGPHQPNAYRGNGGCEIHEVMIPRQPGIVSRAHLETALAELLPWPVLSAPR